MPYAARREDLLDLTGKFNRVFEVVKHRNRGDDLRRCEAGISVDVARKEVRNKLNIAGVELVELLAGGIDTHARQAWHNISL